MKYAIEINLRQRQIREAIQNGHVVTENDQPQAGWIWREISVTSGGQRAIKQIQAVFFLFPPHIQSETVTALSGRIVDRVGMLRINRTSVHWYLRL